MLPVSNPPFMTNSWPKAVAPSVHSPAKIRSFFIFSLLLAPLKKGATLNHYNTIVAQKSHFVDRKFFNRQNSYKLPVARVGKILLIRERTIAASEITWQASKRVLRYISSVH